MEIARRQFLKVCTALAAEAALLSVTSCTGTDKMGTEEGKEGLPKRLLGKTGCRVSILGLGGMTVRSIEQQRAHRLVIDSIDKGVNYFDVAPTYGDAELKFGSALKPYRDRIFLACKTTCRDKEGAQNELRNSLTRLQTDYIDLYQFHALNDIEKDLHALLGKGGAMEAFLEARKQGLIRHIGFSAHSKEAALAAIRGFDFDTIMFPLNFVCHYKADFVTEVVAEAKKRNMGIIAIKSMTKQPWPEGSNRIYPGCWYQPVDEPDLAKASLGFSYAHGAAAVLPPGDERLYRLALDLASGCLNTPLSQLKDLEKAAADMQPIFTI